MKISLVMATYNGEEFLIEQLDSIRNQSREVDEVIICDDCSKDNTVSIIKKYIMDYELKNWNLLVNKQNLGYADNFHYAMTKATGDLIVFSDQDDIWLYDRIEKMEKCFIENKNIKVLYSEFELFYTSKKVQKIDSPVLKAMKYDNTVERVNLSPSMIFIKTEGCTMMLRKDFFQEVNKYWFSGFAHDEFVWKMALCSDGLYVLHMVTLQRRIHSNNVSLNKLHDWNKRVTFLENLCNGHKAMFQYAKHCHIEDKKLKLIKDNIKSSDMRIHMIKDKKYIYIIPLIIRYAHCYYSIKSIPVEFFMAFRRK